jgi:hypothetical protein
MTFFFSYTITIFFYSDFQFSMPCRIEDALVAALEIQFYLVF